jgi:1-acyl-sn-glycerol-3-phosphate acyltransferase
MEQIADVAGFYQTIERCPSLIARIFPSLTFYYRFLRLVFHFSARAKAGQYGDEEWQQSSLAVLRALESVGVGVEISGMAAIHKVAGPCVFIANHMSTLETIILPGVIQPLKDVTFVVKRGIAEYPVFKHIILSRQPIVVDRVSPRDDLARVLEEGSRLLGQGRSVIVFPQTTRTLTFDPAHFNTMGVKLARKASAPMLPVAVKSDAWGIGKLVKEFGKIDPAKKVQIAFGEPLEIQGRGHEAHNAVVEFIAGKLQSWQSLNAHA